MQKGSNTHGEPLKGGTYSTPLLVLTTQNLEKHDFP
jgi:hypothetical protein